MMEQVKPASAALSLLIRRTVHGTPDMVFNAWTSAKHIMKWWGPAHVSCPDCEMDLRVGGRYRIANLLPDGSVIWIIGQFLRVEQPNLVEYSWQSGENPEFDPDAEQRVTVRFIPRGQKTEVVVEHQKIPDEQTQRNHNAGWRGCLDGLEHYSTGTSETDGS